MKLSSCRHSIYQRRFSLAAGSQRTRSGHWQISNTGRASQAASSTCEDAIASALSATPCQGPVYDSEAKFQSETSRGSRDQPTGRGEWRDGSACLLVNIMTWSLAWKKWVREQCRLIQHLLCCCNLHLLHLKLTCQGPEESLGRKTIRPSFAEHLQQGPNPTNGENGKKWQV